MRIFLTWLCLVSACCGNWDTNIWPSWTAQSEGRAQTEQAYSSVWERCAFAKTSLPTAPTWWISQRANLVNIKSALAGTIGGSDWLRVVPGDDVEAIVWTNLVTDYTVYTQVVDLATWTVTGLLAVAHRPVNYFTYTPWSCLNENGPFTNDAGVVGRGHGWTNASTAAGGTNFPAGRSVWYTTDYGREGIPDVVSNLIAIRERPVFSAPTNNNRRYGWVSSLTVAGHSWAYAEAQVEAQFMNTTSSYTGDALVTSYYKQRPFVPHSSLPGVVISRSYMVSSHTDTNGISRKVMSFAWAPDSKEYDVISGASWPQLDFNGDGNEDGTGFTHGWNVMGVTDGYTNLTTVSTGPFGNTNLGANGSSAAANYIPNITSNNPPSVGASIRGYRMGGYYVLGGFEAVKVVEADFIYK